MDKSVKTLGAKCKLENWEHVCMRENVGKQAAIDNDEKVYSTVWRSVFSFSHSLNIY